MTEDRDRDRFEVAYARKDEQMILSVTAGKGLTAQEAIEQSGILRRFPEIDLKVNRVGVFGKLTRLDQILDPGDRVEIYRPLIADPKEIRRKRAAQGKATRKQTRGKSRPDRGNDIADREPA